MSLPGICVYRSDLTLEDILSVEFTHEELELEYNKLMSKTIPGNIGLEYSTSHQTEDQLKNLELVLRFYRKILA